MGCRPAAGDRHPAHLRREKERHWPPPENYLPLRVARSVGDAFNIKTIKTIGPDRIERPILIIITGHGEAERRVRAAARAAGYPDAIINVETISPVIAPLGISRDGKEASWLGFVHRVAVPQDEAALAAWHSGAWDWSRHELPRDLPELYAARGL